MKEDDIKYSMGTLATLNYTSHIVSGYFLFFYMHEDEVARSPAAGDCMPKYPRGKILNPKLVPM